MKTTAFGAIISKSTELRRYFYLWSESQARNHHQCTKQLDINPLLFVFVEIYSRLLNNRNSRT
jgi:hypothetical protein